ncbi:MAG TPA: ORF6N domain-containing protein [Bryobacteraceae bacterium]|nr:ORF6N domain-containing protein [Bryobacteraceae bacterium]
MPVLVVERRIYLIRGRKVMIDREIAELYEVPTKVLNQAVRRNVDRFPADFMFQLTRPEADSLRSQIVTSNDGRGGRRYSPYAFTQEGVAMLSSVLRSERAVKVNIAIMRAFVKLRETLATNRDLAIHLEKLKKEQHHQGKQIKRVFLIVEKLLEPRPIPPVPPKRRIGFR